MCILVTDIFKECPLNILSLLGFFVSFVVVVVAVFSGVGVILNEVLVMR